MQIVSGLILAIASFFDIKNKKVPVIYINCSITLALIVAIVASNHDIIHILLSLIPGIAFWLISICLEGTVGRADGLVILVMGLLNGIRELCLILLLSFGLAAIASLFMIGILKKGRNATLPFIPFLFISQIITIIFSI